MTSAYTDSADSASATVMSEIIKSKYKLYAALNKIKDTNNICKAIPVVDTSGEPDVQLSKRKDAEVSNNTAKLSSNAICESSLAESAKPQSALLPLHQFKKRKPETSTGVMAPPIVFVPPVLGQPVLSSPSKVKRNRRKKKKAKMGVQIGPQ